ncbi:Os06g0619600 [Oryza sativa Japonica Group]|uniref:Receptor-like serine/threonine-protein kinase n=2 Tax=Oryza sativa subsp. japonica TaxID=39947 RepID=A0A0P0WZ55_ORYSJ|nr:hypothetical protein OsJ_21989 [Oryza sativa Japonica Group]KAF2927598.1 hypothetical protein DAI22_06g216400 [Oryza sativa Japonica Group]BAD35435.1 putative S-receptor kinase [Oryza sativa Japonica Group]BAS98648.1 Os06g0619600 [Oryza sativa Japonica Group]
MKPFAGISVSSLAPLLLLLVLHQPHQLEAENRNLTAGNSLRPPEYITSPSGDFAFGFRALDSGGPDSLLFLLAVWFNDNTAAADPVQQKAAVVWHATDPDGSGSAVTATTQSVFSVNFGQLSLANNGSRNIWTNVNPAQPNGFVLVLLDSGNLQFLTGGDNSVVWESFRHPTDTLLPGQSMGAGENLRSKRTDADFSAGRFGLFVQADGNIVLYIGGHADSSRAYWATRTQQPSNTQDGNTTLFFASTGSIYYQIKNGSLYDLTPPMASSTAGGSYRRATLDPDGVVRVYIRPRSSANASWTVADLFPAVGCGMSTRALDGFCGPNSYCVVSGADSRLDCACPSNYSFIDKNIRYEGCRPAFAPQSCDVVNSSAEFEITKLPNTTWTTSPYVIYERMAEEQCADICLRDCFCVAALFEPGATRCTKMALLAGSGRQERSVTQKALIKVRTSRSPPAPPSRGRVPLLPYIILGCLAFLIILAAATSLLLHWHMRRINNNDHDIVRHFTKKELHRATNGFQRLLGRGGFGEVYHGVAKSLHPPDIAVKKLVTSNEYSEREFANEVQSIGRIHHRNLVRMLGYCKEREQRMLVFEFMPGGSLRSFLFQTPRPPWSWRAEAALGIAKGIEYLHEGCTLPIIHCDIKPDNILLDDRNNPKITDFGIARLLGDQQMYTTVTNVRGTRGYIAPEWFHSERRIDTKVDVYSFGVVLLEMICCRRCQDPVTSRGEGGDDHDNSVVTLFGWASQLVNHGRVEVILHSDDDAVEDLERVERFVRVAFLCIETNPSLRPMMHQVVQMLEGVVEVHAMPHLPSSIDTLPSISKDSRTPRFFFSS